MTTNPLITEKRRAQLREAQRKRRQALSHGDRHQLNIYLTVKAIKILDSRASELGLDRHELIEKLILAS